MSFVQREIDRVRVALGETPYAGERFNELYAAQQALSWALEPTGAKSPYDMITEWGSPVKDLPPPSSE